VAVPTVVVTSDLGQAPPAEDCRALLDVARLGYYRGVMNLLDQWTSTHPACQGFTERMQGLARQYQFETMAAQLQKALDASPVD
jgi:hypothetical protein